MLQTEVSLLEQALRTLRVEDKIVIEDMGSLRGVYLSGYYLAEKKIAERVQQLRNAPRRIRFVQTEPALDYVQKKLSVTLATKQIEAIKSAITQKILIITGAPGTGKTTIIKSILEIISKLTLKILLTAPTGRAAKRMSETTGYEAKTIHRLLDFNVMAGSFQKNEESPLDCDLIILDEAFMVDTLLMHHLLKAIPSHAIFIIVGDINQLPSVGAGNVLKDMIQSEAVPVVQLNEIFRQAQQSHIIMNAHRIIQGQYPYVDNQEKTDFYFLQEDPEKVLEIILKLVTERIPRKFGFNPLQDIQVLSPMNRGIVGTVPLNEALQKALNPVGKEYLRGSRTYRIHDKVMQIRNNYDKEVFNGDMGFITDIDTENQVLHVYIEGRDVSYEFSELDKLVLAYAVSIHKSQGSEYPVVVIPLTMSHFMMLQRNLVYTGITEAKNLLLLLEALKQCILRSKITRS